MITTVFVIQDTNNIYSLLQLDNSKYFYFIKLLRKIHSQFSLPCFSEASSTSGFCFKLTNTRIFFVSLIQDYFSLDFWYGEITPGVICFMDSCLGFSEWVPMTELFQESLNSCTVLKLPGCESQIELFQESCDSCAIFRPCHKRDLQTKLFQEQLLDMGHTVPQLVEALRYKPEGCAFDSRWCHSYFSLKQFFWLHYGPGVDSASNRNEYENYFLG
jgi:hypothetical protein